MIIEESIFINAPIEKVWQTFTDLTCWLQWNSVLKNVTTEHACIKKGETFSCAIRPFLFPIYFEPLIEEVIPNDRIVWSGSKYGIFARHEFIFQTVEKGVRVTSKETFQGITIENISFIFPSWRIREMTKSLLGDLKKASEALL